MQSSNTYSWNWLPKQRFHPVICPIGQWFIIMIKEQPTIHCHISLYLRIYRNLNGKCLHSAMSYIFSCINILLLWHNVFKNCNYLWNRCTLNSGRWHDVYTVSYASKLKRHLICNFSHFHFLTSEVMYMQQLSMPKQSWSMCI